MPIVTVKLQQSFAYILDKKTQNNFDSLLRQQNSLFRKLTMGEKEQKY